MKKAMVYILAVSVACMTLLAGCGDNRGVPGETAAPINSPSVTLVPETAMPNPENGVVNDRDGIITDGDSGSANGAGEIRTGENKMDTGSGAGTNGKSSAGSAGTGMR